MTDHDRSTTEHPGRGVLGRLLRHWTTSEAQAQAAQLRTASQRAGCDSIASATQRRPARLRGTITSVTINPRGSNRWLEAVLDDGSGEVVLVWMGRRVVKGIEVGRGAEVEGVLTRFEGRSTIYNPKYSLLVR